MGHLTVLSKLTIAISEEESARLLFEVTSFPGTFPLFGFLPVGRGRGGLDFGSVMQVFAIFPLVAITLHEVCAKCLFLFSVGFALASPLRVIIVFGFGFCISTQYKITYEIYSLEF